MTTERDPRTRTVLSWLREDMHENAERVLLSALDEVDTTPQRRSSWPAWRSATMNRRAQAAIAAAAVLVVAILGYNLLPGLGGTGVPSTPAPTTASSMSTATEGPTRPPDTVSFRPFESGGLGMCPAPSVDPTCVEDARDDSISVTVDVPETWDSLGAGAWIDENAPPAGAAVTFARGSWLYSQPCSPDDLGDADIPVGPSVDDFVTALVDHPLLDVTAPVDVTLAGYSGKYLELRVPDDLSQCFRYRPIDQHIYAQGPGQLWRMWVLDVGGVRILVEANHYAGTAAVRLAEEQTIIDSIDITP